MGAVKNLPLGFLIIMILCMALLSIRRYGCDSSNGKPMMVLYGRVVDQMDHPVAGALVDFDGSFYAGVIPFYTGNEHRWSVHTVSAADGSFKIDGGRGDILWCQQITNPKYSEGVFQGPFGFGGGNSLPRYHPDPKHPVLFMMWNNAYKRILSKKLTSSVDGRMNTLMYLTGVVEPNLTMQEDLAFTVTCPHPIPHGPCDWEVNIHGIEGAVLQCDGPLGGTAPTGGYVPALNCAMKADDPHWASTITKRFYTHGTDSKNYAAVKLTAELDANANATIVTIEYTASFDHTPDLIPGPVIPLSK